MQNNEDSEGRGCLVTGLLDSTELGGLADALENHRSCLQCEGSTDWTVCPVPNFFCVEYYWTVSGLTCLSITVMDSVCCLRSWSTELWAGAIFVRLWIQLVPGMRKWKPCLCARDANLYRCCQWPAAPGMGAHQTPMHLSPITPTCIGCQCCPALHLWPRRPNSV